MLRLGIIKHRLDIVEKFSLIFRSVIASQQYITCSRKSLDSDTSKSFNTCTESLADATAQDLFCFLLQFPRPIYSTRVHCAWSRCVIFYAMQMKILCFLFLQEKLLTVKGWMLPSTGVKGYACQGRVKKKKGRVEKIRGISSFFTLSVLPKLLSP